MMEGFHTWTLTVIQTNHLIFLIEKEVKCLSLFIKLLSKIVTNHITYFLCT